MIVWAIFFVIPIVVSAQSLKFTMPDTMPAQLARWQYSSSEIVITSRSQLACRISVWLESVDGAIRLRTPFDKLPMTILPDTLRLPLSSLVAELLLSSERLYARGTLAGGRYRLCVHIAGAVDSTVQYTEPVCKEFEVAGIPPLKLIAPHGILHANDTTRIRFIWSTSRLTNYEQRLQLRIVERRWGQSRWYALMTEEPLVTCAVELALRQLWECTVPREHFVPGKEYVWGIVTVDDSGQIELVSEIAEFRVER